MALTALKVTRLSKRGRYGDGNGLWLQISKWGTKAWLYRYQLGGKAREMGLGPADTISLAAARDMRDEARKLVRAGKDPIAARKAERAAQALAEATAMTFRAAAEATIAAKEDQWFTQEYRQQWVRGFRDHVYPIIGNVAVGAVDTALVLKCIEPIWSKKRVTADRIRSRIEAVLDWAKARGARSGDNPARWVGHIEHLLANEAAAPAVENLKALPYAAVPAFMGELRGRKGYAARALEFTVLTVVRSAAVLHARWSEIDGDVWTVPKERMKGQKDQRREHRVPLPQAAIDLLDELPRQGEFIFPGRSGRKPLNHGAMMELLDAMDVDATVHGFRSTFKDWASDCTSYANEISEMALAHAIKDKTEAAYRRSDLFEKRRRLMEDWGKFCTETPRATSNQVIPIGKRAAT